MLQLIQRSQTKSEHSSHSSWQTTRTSQPEAHAHWYRAGYDSFLFSENMTLHTWQFQESQKKNRFTWLLGFTACLLQIQGWLLWWCQSLQVGLVFFQKPQNLKIPTSKDPLIFLIGLGIDIQDAQFLASVLSVVTLGIAVTEGNGRLE